MNLTIHRGTNEIGGSCVELRTYNTRILIDFGMPLVDKAGNEFNFKNYEKISVDELIKNSILPDISGLYKPTENNVDAVLISHAHADHFGLLNYIDSHVKVFLGAATKDILELSGIFTPYNIQLNNYELFEKNKSFNIGDFKITPYWVDHSAFDSYLFLIEGDEKRIIYSGDFRGHGRKKYGMQKFMDNAPRDIDYLIMEGTQIGRNQDNSKTEDDIELKFRDRFSEDKVNIVSASGQNVDRIVSIVKACYKANKTLVVDVYIAKILKTLSKYNKFPYPSTSSKIKVLFTKYTPDRLVRLNRRDILNEFSKSKISRNEINNNPSKYVLIVRPSLLIDLQKMPNLTNGNYIYSMWQGYKRKPDTKKLLDYLTQKGFTTYDIHTSGHADYNTLQKFANSINPNNIIPIHTFGKSQYQSIFKHNVILLNDNDMIML
ncbi:MBL fold metallo-hydrolase [Bacteroidota bacterium]